MAPSTQSTNFGGHVKVAVGGHGAAYAPRRSKSCIQQKCDPCLRLFKWLPVIFITLVLGWGYYAYVIQLCFFTIDSVILRIVCIIVFHFFYIMTLWSYYQTVMAEVGSVPREFWLTVNDLEAISKEQTEDERKAAMEGIVASRNLPIACRTYTGEYRLCEKCNLIKPDRAHHCSVCDCCVLKMDHHCPWVNNCVCFSNYKFFVLFLGYAFSLCLFSAITSFQYFLQFWKNELHNLGKLHILFLFFVSIMFAISLVSLFAYHVFLVLKNRSTLESFRAPVFRFGPDKKAYDLGSKRNWEEIFGQNKQLWFVPLHTLLESGLTFPQRGDQVSEDIEVEGRRPLLLSRSDSDDGAAMDESYVTIDLKDDVADYELNTVSSEEPSVGGDDGLATATLQKANGHSDNLIQVL